MTLNRLSRRIRGKLARKGIRHFRPQYDLLEDWMLLSTIIWTGDAGDNNWDTPANWSGDAVPTASEDVVINQTGTTIGVSGNDSANSLNSQNAIAINGSLSLASSFTINNTLTITGTMSGSGNVSVSGMFTWGPDSTLNGSGTIDAEGGLTIVTDPSNTGEFNAFYGYTLNNYGAATWTGVGGIQADYGAVFNNLAGASFDVQGDGSFYYPGRGAQSEFNNAGTLTKSVGSNSSSTSFAPFNNSGSVILQTGNLSVGSFGNVGNIYGYSSGSFTAASGTTLTLESQILSPTSSVSGDAIVLVGCSVGGSYTAAGSTTAGSTTFSGSVASLGAVFNASSIQYSNGAVDFSPSSGPTTVTTGQLNITTGLSGSGSIVVTGATYWGPDSTLNGSGTIDAEGGLTIVTDPSNTGEFNAFYGYTLNNYGAATWTGVGGIQADYGAVFNNLAGASFDVQGDGSFYYPGRGAQSEFNNAGTLTKSVGSNSSSTSFAPFNNSGSVILQTGNLDFGTSLVNSGSVTIASGTNLTEDGYSQTNGSTVLNGGTLDGGPININGGTLIGSGVINADVAAAGQVIPGGTGSAGLLSINGNYTQTAAGSIDVDLGGTTAGSQYDQLVVSGQATLSGNLSISEINGFSPTLAQTFTIASSNPLSGTFTSVTEPGVSGPMAFKPTYTSSSVVLVAEKSSTTTFTSSVNPSVFGQSVTFTATVRRPHPAAARPRAP